MVLVEVFSRVIATQMLDHAVVKDVFLRALCVADRSLTSTPVSKSFASCYLYTDFHADRRFVACVLSFLRFTNVSSKSSQEFLIFGEDASFSS